MTAIQSAQYSADSPSDNHDYYTPTSNSYAPTSPCYSATTPTTYHPVSPSYHPLSPSYHPTYPTYSPRLPAQPLLKTLQAERDRLPTFFDCDYHALTITFPFPTAVITKISSFLIIAKWSECDQYTTHATPLETVTGVMIDNGITAPSRDNTVTFARLTHEPKYFKLIPTTNLTYSSPSSSSSSSRGKPGKQPASPAPRYRTRKRRREEDISTLRNRMAEMEEASKHQQMCAFTQGLKMGRVSGEEAGRAAGVRLGLVIGREQGIARGTKRGFESGAEAVCNHIVPSKQQQAYHVGHSLGWDSGETEGYGHGHDDGFATGVSHTIMLLREYAHNTSSRPPALLEALADKADLAFFEGLFARK